MVEIISIAMVVVGLVFFLGAVVGIMRFPDFYTRMHAAGKGDTLSTILIIGGIGLYYMHGHDWSWSAVLVGLKLLGIVVFIFIASPTSTHVLMQAGFDSGSKPILEGDDRAKDGKEPS